MQNSLAIAEQAEVIQAAGPQTRDAEASLDFIKRYEIKNGASFSGAVRMVAEVKTQWLMVDAKRKQYTAKLAEIVDQFNGEFKPGLEALKEAEKALKDKLAEFAKSQGEQRAQKLREASTASETGDQAKADALIAEAETFEVPTVKGCSIRDVWTGEVEDPEAIPREYLIPDEKTLKALTKAKKCDPKIPGWRAYPQPSVTITVSRVQT
jgi:hypothetical protein